MGLQAVNGIFFLSEAWVEGTLMVGPPVKPGQGVSNKVPHECRGCGELASTLDTITLHQGASEGSPWEDRK